MNDCMVTSDTPTHPCYKLSPGTDRLWACESDPVLHTKLHFKDVVCLPQLDLFNKASTCTSYSEQIQCSREEGGKGTKRYLPAQAADTPLSMKNGSHLLEVDSKTVVAQLIY
jgi:hypothetical protein